MPRITWSPALSWSPLSLLMATDPTVSSFGSSTPWPVCYSTFYTRPSLLYVHLPAHAALPAWGSSITVAPLPGTCQDLIEVCLCGCRARFKSLSWFLVDLLQLGIFLYRFFDAFSLCCSLCSLWHSYSPGIGLLGLFLHPLTFVFCFSFLGNLLGFIFPCFYCFLNSSAIIFSNFSF